MKCNQSRRGFELVSPCPFPTTITITPRAPPCRLYSCPWTRNDRQHFRHACESRLGWAGHVSRMGNNHLPKMTLYSQFLHLLSRQRSSKEARWELLQKIPLYLSPRLLLIAHPKLRTVIPGVSLVKMPSPHLKTLIRQNNATGKTSML